LIAPILVGPEARIRAAAREAGKDIAGYRLVPAQHSHEAAALAVDLVHRGEAALLMKGSLHTDELMGAVVSGTTGLRMDRRISHAYVMDVPGYPRPLIITDAAINIAPTLEEKADIIRNAIDLAHVLGIASPKVAILAAVETVNPAMRATLEAAALCKMADRGQITGGLLDGPLAFDNAVSRRRRPKSTSSRPWREGRRAGRARSGGGQHAGQAADLPGQADAAGVVLGARAHHPDQPCRQSAHAAGVLRGGGADGAQGRRVKGCSAQRGLLQHQVLALHAGG
jgi:phosphotransacetylase